MTLCKPGHAMTCPKTSWRASFFTQTHLAGLRTTFWLLLDIVSFRSCTLFSKSSISFYLSEAMDLFQGQTTEKKKTPECNKSWTQDLMKTTSFLYRLAIQVKWLLFIQYINPTQGSNQLSSDFPTFQVANSAQLWKNLKYSFLLTLQTLGSLQNESAAIISELKVLQRTNE